MTKRRIKAWARATAVLSLAAFLPLATTGCFGKFQLTRKVYTFNKDVDPDKWIQWFTFLVLSIVPVYGVAFLVDVVFANSVEFWTGENPIQASAGSTRVAYGPNGEFVRATLRADGSIELLAIDAKGIEYELTVVREGDSLAARDADGKLVARVAERDGRPALVEAAGL